MEGINPPSIASFSACPNECAPYIGDALPSASNVCQIQPSAMAVKSQRGKGGSRGPSSAIAVQNISWTDVGHQGCEALTCLVLRVRMSKHIGRFVTLSKRRNCLVQVCEPFWCTELREIIRRQKFKS